MASIECVTRGRRRFGLSGAGIAVTFSLLGHAGVGLFAVHHSHTPAERVAKLDSALPALEADFVTTEDDDAPPPADTPTVSTVAVASHASRALATRGVSVAPGASTKTDADPQPAAVAPTVAQDSSGPHFAMTVAPVVGNVTGVTTLAAPSSSVGLSTGSGAAPIAAASADIQAKLRAGNTPAYTAAALSAGVEANVPLEIVINESGVVVSARVLEPAGYGLDEAARRGVLAYRFTPAVRGGKPVAVRMRWLMRFQLS